MGMRADVEGVLSGDPSRRWTLVAVAETLGLSKGAVQRGLKAEGTNFTQVRAGLAAAPAKKKAPAKQAAPKKAPAKEAAPKKGAAKKAPAKKPGAKKSASAAKKPAPAKKAPAKKAEPASEAPLPPAPEGFEAPPPADFAELPVAYGVDRVSAMATDPHTLFVYWELTPGGVSRARAKASGALNLRVYSIDAEGTQGAPLHDIEVQDWISQVTLRFDAPGKRVVAVLGARDDNGLVHIVRSHIVELPRLSPGNGPVVFSQVVGAKVEPVDGTATSDPDALRGFRLAQLFGQEATDLNRMLGSSDTLQGANS